MAHRRLGAIYARSFEKRPWMTLAVANGTLGALADVLAQSLERFNGDRSSKRDTIQWDIWRTIRFFAFGVMMAPVLDKWNRFIEHRFPLRDLTGSKGAGKASTLALGKRVAVDQIGFAPFGLACFVGAMGTMEGRDLPGIRQKFGEMYLSALVANWQLWPFVQAINFRFMPLRYRVPFTGAVGIAWQVFLSILNASSRKTQVGETPNPLHQS